MSQYFEYRGVENAVFAEVTADDANNYTTGPVKRLVGLSEIGKTTDSANEAHYYDNIPAIVVSSTGADEITLNTSGIPFDVLAEITGQYYDQTSGLLVEQERTPKYFALGYITNKTDGTEVLVWRLKGTFTIPEQTSATKNDGTDANGQSMTYTGISTAHKFAATGKPAKAVNVDTAVNQTMTESTFFSQVQTPDSISGTTVHVTGVGVVPSSLSLEIGEEATLRAEVAPANATNKAVTYTTSAEAVATVTSAGVVKAVAAGSATITATTTDGNYTDTCAVTVAE